MDPLEGHKLAWSDLDAPAGPRVDCLKAGDVVRKFVTLARAASVDRKLMQLEAVVSGEKTRDSYGDITRVQGWDFDRWLLNPVVMWAHSYWMPPIANGLWIRAEAEELVSRMQFWNGDGEWGDFAREMFEMYAATPAFLRGFSVGFMPTKWEPLYEKDEEDGREHFVGYDYLEKELWEYSCVPIPAYAGALARAIDERAARAIGADLFVKAMPPASAGNFASPEPTPEPAVTLAGQADLRDQLTSLWAQSAGGNLRQALRRARQ